MKKKYQIFISSTYTDLISQRNAVRDTILRMNHFPVGMEQFGAANEEQWEIIKETIDTSDFYVLIIGHRYGSVIQSGEDAGISYTEKEYRYAQDIGVPILAFLPDKNVPMRADQQESDDKKKKLEAFVEAVKSKRLIEFWMNENDLSAKVTAALYKQFDRTDRLGWVRGGESEKSLQTIVDLHEQINVLKEENEELKKSIVIRKPQLVIDISCVETLEEAEDKAKKWNNSDNREYPLYEEADDKLIIYMRRIPHEGYLGNTDKMTMDDIPDYLNEFVSENDLKEYNEQLPDVDSIKNYNSKMHLFKSIKENGLVLEVNVLNDGNIKATDINIDVEFPDSFLVMSRSEAIDITAPRRLKMPENPIIKAEEEYNKRDLSRLEYPYISPLEQYASATADLFTKMGGLGGTSRLPDLSEIIADKESGCFVTDDGHSVHIWRDALLHTYEWHSRGFVVAPTAAGEFTVKISAICEEMADPIESEYKIVVVDKGY